MSQTVTTKAYLKFKGKMKGEIEERWFKPTLTLGEFDLDPNNHRRFDVIEVYLEKVIDKWLNKKFKYLSAPMQVNIVKHVKDFLDSNIEINFTEKIHDFVLFEREVLINQMECPDEQTP